MPQSFFSRQDGTEKTAVPVVASNVLPPISDPLDFFGAIRSLVESGLSVEDRAKLPSINQDEKPVVFPVDESILREDKSELQLKVSSLELALREKETSAKDAEAAALAAELEIQGLREKHASACQEAQGAREEQAHTEALLLSAQDRLQELEGEVARAKADAEREAQATKAATEQLGTELDALRVKIGRPTESQEENSEFMELFEGKSKVEVTAQALAGTAHKMDLDSTMTELVNTKKKLDGLKGAFQALRQEHDAVVGDRARVQNEARTLCEHIQQAAASMESAKNQADSAIRREREETLRVKETLAFERDEFRRYRDTMEAKMKRLRQEAARAEELEEQVANKTLRLKQKEAEARALTSDSKMVRVLRETLTSKDEALAALRQECEALRAANAAKDQAIAAAEAEALAARQRAPSGPDATPPPVCDVAGRSDMDGAKAHGRIGVNGHSAVHQPGTGEGSWSSAHVPATQGPSTPSAIGLDAVKSCGGNGLMQASPRRGMEIEEDDEGALGVIAEEDSEVESADEDEGQEEEEEEDEEEDDEDEDEQEDDEDEGDEEEEEEEEDDEDDEEEDDEEEDGEGDEDLLEGGDEDAGEELAEGDTEGAEDAEDAGDSSGGADGAVDECPATPRAHERGALEERCSLTPPVEMAAMSSPDSDDVDEEDGGHDRQDGKGKSVEASKATGEDGEPGDQEEKSDGVASDVESATTTEAAFGAAGAAASDSPNASDSSSDTRGRPRLSLEKGKYAETDEEAEAFAVATFAAEIQRAARALGKDGGRNLASSRRWRRDSRSRSVAGSLKGSSSLTSSLSPCSRGPATSFSLSPQPRERERVPRCTHERSPSLAGAATSPMSRLQPVEHGMEGHGNTVVIELGSWKVRAGVVDTDTNGRGSFFDDFPCCLARPKAEGADLDELVNGASSLASPMYSKFRNTGVFVGGDAWYCCMDHPDSGLRSKLRLSCPLERGRVKPRDGGPTSDDVERLLEHACGILKQEPTTTPILVTYKPTAEPEEIWDVAAILMETLRVPAVRLANEAQLAALAAEVTNGVVVDIGESGTYVTPIFDGLPVARAARWQPCGGMDLTKYLDYMLLSRTNETFNQMVDRRRLEYSKRIKETHCFVAKDFDEEAERCGLFRRKTMRVFQGAQVSPKLANYEACTYQEFNEDNGEDDPVTISFTQKAGTQLDMRVGRERFHAPELLFQPDLWGECENTDGLDDMVMDALSTVDAEVRGSMLGDVVLVGGSAAIPGLAERLQQDLAVAVPEHLTNRVRVRALIEETLDHSNSRSRGSPTAVTVGAELLLLAEKNDTKAWIRASDWEQDSDVIRRQWYIL